MRYFIVVVGVVALLGGLGGMKFAQIKSLIAYGHAAVAAGPPPEVVGTSLAKQATWENRIFSVGTIAPVRGVTVSNDSAGVVSAIKFESGQKVRRGQVLVELDSRVERAELASTQAQLSLARVSAGRARTLFKEDAVPKAQLDNAESALQSAAANAAALQAQIDRKVVRAPFDGRLGIRLINLGQYLNPGTAITDLQSTDANYVDFTLPQQQLDQLAVGMAVRINEGLPGPRAEAAIAAIDPTLDPVTRSGRVRAAVRKMEGLVSPGMFVNVSVVLPQKRNVTLVGATSLIHASFGDSVFAVEESQDDAGAVVMGRDGKPAKMARQQFVKTGEARGDFVEILEGVKQGQEIVAQGAFKLRNGAPVLVNNSVKVEPEIAPRPENR
ncbi:MAG: efflux RND transporter periplasmic adaptor subunit [Polyangia bacterium]